MLDGNAHLRLVVAKPNVMHAVTFALTHRHVATEFRLTHGPSVPASASQGEPPNASFSRVERSAGTAAEQREAAASAGSDSWAPRSL